jgi:hypothetical protein
MTRSLDARVDSLERVYGVDDGPPIIVLFVGGPDATETDPETAIRQTIERDPGRPVYVVHVARSEGTDGA